MKFLLLTILFGSFFSCSVWANDLDCSRFPRDCKILNRFQKLQSAFNELGVDPNFITRFRALRFIDIESYEKNRNFTSVEDIYEQRDLSISHINPWQRWTTSAEVIDRELSIDDLSIELIKKIHSFSMRKDLSLSLSEVRNSYLRNNPRPLGFEICEDEEVVPCMNEWFKARELIWKTNDLQPRLYIPKEGWVYYPPSDRVQEFTENWTRRLKIAIREIKEKRRSPIDTALSFQREFVAIHPFDDGNGRVSRFLQDLILKKFSFPAIPSGYLTDEFTTFRNDYVNKGYEVLEKELSHLENCFLEHKENQISYDCKVLN